MPQSLIRIEKFNAQKGRQLMDQFKLFRPGWAMRVWVEDAADLAHTFGGSDNCAVYVAFRGRIGVGCFVVIDNEITDWDESFNGQAPKDKLGMCFIPKPYRRQGIASKLASAAKNDYDFFARVGEDGSAAFWSSHNIQALDL